jgi:uncharacterized protein YukE
MSFEGMDVDQLQGLAKQVDADARALYSLVNSLNGVIGGLTFLWNGPVAATFEQNWQSKNRPALLAAYNTLTNLHARLVDNINQQTSASAAEGGWTTGSVTGQAGSGWTTGRVISDAENVLTAVGLIGLAAPKGSVPGQLLEDIPLVGKVKGVLDPIGTAVGVYKTGEDFNHSREYLAQDQYVNAANSFVNGIGDGLETAGGQIVDKNWELGLVVYGAGLDVKLLDEVANVDWKDMPNPLSGENWKYYVPEMNTSAYWKQVGETFWGAA